jgi:hypothetical protein
MELPTFRRVRRKKCSTAEPAVKIANSRSDPDESSKGMMFFLGLAVGISVPLAILAFN